jgi:hypothetical protein
VQSQLFRYRWYIAIGAAAIVFVVTLFGGYRGHWSWTGYSDNDTLWDWLKLLLLPLVLASAPIWMRKGSRMHQTRRRLLQGAVVLLIILIILGYGFDQGWTGFSDNKLWDWFELLLLPLSLAAIRVWRKLDERHLKPWHKAAIAGLVGAFALFVIGGYELEWSWTGFQGNTLWDWIQLVLAPLLFPLIVVPTTVAWMSAEVKEEAEELAEERDELADRACGTVHRLGALPDLQF